MHLAGKALVIINDRDRDGLADAHDLGYQL
jgi:hypothetical protein